MRRSAVTGRPWASNASSIARDCSANVWYQRSGATSYGRVPTVTHACPWRARSEEHTSELQSRRDLVCRLLLEKTKKQNSKLTGYVVDQQKRRRRRDR